jgi:putative transposase
MRPRFGNFCLHILPGREGLVVNHKRIYRIYRAAVLQVRRRRRKRLTRGDRVPLRAQPALGTLVDGLHGNLCK